MGDRRGLRVADGSTLGGLALDVAPRGVAVQVRVNAETLRPDGTLLPGDGTLSRFQPPAGRGVRVDTAGYPGYTVSPRYDSLLAKVIAHAPDREAALRLMARGLERFRIGGIETTAPLLHDIVSDPAFTASPVTTRWLESEFIEPWLGTESSE